MNLAHVSADQQSKKAWFVAAGWLFGANVTRNLGLFVVLVLLARFTNPAALGTYSLALAITAPIFIFAQLGLKSVYLTHRNDFRFSRYLIVQGVALVLALLLSTAVTSITNPKLNVIVLLVGIVRIGDAISELYAGPLQAVGSASWVFWGALASAVVGSLLATWCLVATRSLELALISLAFGTLLASATTMWLPAQLAVTRKEELFAPGAAAADPILSIVRAGVPSGAGSSLIALVASVPSYFLAATWGADAVAQYAILFYVIMVADIFVGTLTQGWITRARAINDRRDSNAKGLFRVTVETAMVWSAVMLPVAIVGVIVAALLLPIVFGPQYTLSVSVAIPITLMVAIAPILNFSGIAVAVRNLYLHTLSLSVISALTAILLGAIVIPAFGVTGAFWTFTLAAAARAIPTLVLIKRSERSSASLH